ncbi:MAG: hypothetical protein RIR70_935, partial [Pseudomonadota bacterium]
PATAPVAPKVHVEPLPAKDLTGQILYQSLLGEIAAERGDSALMLRAYSELSRNTRDPRIVRRAAELALDARQPDYALEAAKLWVDIDPESPAARQMLAGINVGLGRFDDAVPHVAKLLSLENENLPSALLRLNRLFGRSAEKVAVTSVVDKLTEPYLAHPEAWFARSEAANIAGDPKTALAAIDRAIALRPEWELATLQKVQLIHATSPKEAIELMRVFLKAYPNARDVRLNYARALTGEQRFADARREFEALQREFPDNLDVLYAVGVLSMQLGDFDAAVPSFQALIDKGYTEPNQIRLYLGQIAEHRKRQDEALGWYYTVTAGEHYLPAQVRIAAVLAAQGKVDEARMSLQNATASTRRERLQLVLAEAQLLREAGRAEEAFALLEKNVARDPDDLDLLYETALMAERVGKVDVTEAHLRRVIAKKPDHAHAYNALGYSLADRNLRLEEAQSLIEKALSLAPSDPFILDSMGWVLFRRGDAAGAVKYLSQAFELRPDPEIAAHLGEVLWVAGKRDEATRVWREALIAHPGNEPLNETVKRFLP